MLNFNNLEITSLIQSVRQLAGAAETEKALEQLIAFLGRDNRYDALHRTAIQTLAQWQQTKQEETVGIISFDNARLSYNQVTHRLLLILDRLEAGKTTLTDEAPPRRKKWWMVAVPAAIILAITGWLVIRNLYHNDVGTQIAAACPDYSETSAFNILVFRFQRFGDRELSTHQALIRRLAQLSERYGIAAEVGIFNDGGDDKKLPVSLRQAERMAETCRAQLVITGTEEAGTGGNIITTQYRFLNLGEQFAFRQLRVNERTEIDTITSISSITTNGSITGNLEQSILLLFGVVAHETRNNKVATELLAAAEITDSATTLLRDMLLADSYLAMDDPEKAVAAYDRVLELHPNYAFALQNRAALYVQKGDYTGAIKDLSAKLELNPRDAATLQQRGTIFLEAEQLNRAKSDFERARSLKPADTSIFRRLNEVDIKIEEQRRINQEAERTLRFDPDNIKALTDRAAASRKLGDHATAVATAERVLQRDPKNIAAYGTLVESFIEQEQPEKAAEVLRRIKAANINRTELLRTSPRVKNLVD
ncbi:MAG TPA: tetratricopeptide repeat protein [Saprospiraceae bacterium]|nr:tetratricopeptide repeat protein [Saprospiraceae bacterium]HMP26034.1 tetratricopeptide repeat protein [Saprospiraceae bacterium]